MSRQHLLKARGREVRVVRTRIRSDRFGCECRPHNPFGARGSPIHERTRSALGENRAIRDKHTKTGLSFASFGISPGTVAVANNDYPVQINRLNDYTYLLPLCCGHTPRACMLSVGR